MTQKCCAVLEVSRRRALRSQGNLYVAFMCHLLSVSFKSLKLKIVLGKFLNLKLKVMGVEAECLQDFGL